MKKLLVYILLLASNISSACGFYPYGEDVRMSFLHYSLFNCKSFDGFHYSSNSYYDPSSSNEYLIDNNDKLWFQYCKKKVPIELAAAMSLSLRSSLSSSNCCLNREESKARMDNICTTFVQNSYFLFFSFSAKESCF